MTPTDALARVVAALPVAEDRPGQREMASAVSAAITDQHHLVVQAGTGTGKTLGYLVPAIVAGKRTVVATATKALQDQLAAKDLPFLERHLGVDFTWSVLKGRSNYLCMQRVRELANADTGQLELEDMAGNTKLEIFRLAEWAAETPTGDAADLPEAVSDRAWQAVTVGSDECPGAKRCPMGDVCFAEAARRRAEVADVIVVNLHLYGLDVASEGVILPPHDVVVVDEAHQLEDIASDTVGLQIAPSRFVTVAAALRKVLAEPEVPAAIAEAASALREVLQPSVGQRLGVPLPEAVVDVLVDGRRRLDAAMTALRALDAAGKSAATDEVKQRVLRGSQLTGRLMEAIDVAVGVEDGWVPFVSGSPEQPRLEIAPLDVAPILREVVWSRRTAVLTSATLPPALPVAVGLPAERTVQLDVGSPFDYPDNGLLYCARHLPDPRDAKYASMTHDELVALIGAAGGRTLALFTSWKAMDAAVAAVRPRVDVPILSQRDLPKNRLVAQFVGDEPTCLFATAGFFQGFDAPGRTLSLVVIDRIPFPRPDDPLLSARREALGPAAFRQIDLPRAATLLAQATGRLIRTATDRGVVAVLDRRLSTANYGWDIVKALPPMRRTRHRTDAETFLRDIVAP